MAGGVYSVMARIFPLLLFLVAPLALAVAAPTVAFAAKKHRREAGQIACTIVGCIHIPPECHPEMGYTNDGTPTGFDIVVCPGAAPLYGNPLF
jgi:hypothetical protein